MKMVNFLNRPEMLNLDFDVDDLPLAGDEEVKLEPEEAIAERIKLNPRKRKTRGTGLNYSPNKLLTRLPILLAQIKAGNTSNILKTEIRQLLYPLYHHDKVTKKFYNNLIKSL